mmetsp:Transcript_22961/g.38656  ORF Transcript_22961/g.38656 Transcript_22961/m.38656 type:complete len:458 (-) Transcript_22961:76-1449(-)
MLGHGSCGVRGQELHGGRVGRCRGHNDCVFNRTGLFELFHQLGHCGPLLTNSNIDAIELLALVIACRVVIGFLVQDRVQSNGSFAGLTVPNDQLSLATANWDHRVHGLEACRHRLVHRFAGDDAGGLAVRDAALGCGDGPLAVQRVAQTVNDATQQLVTRRHVHDGVGALDGVTFFNVAVRAEDNHTDIVGFQVQRHALNTTGEFDHLTGLDIVEAINAGNTVAHGQNAAHFGHFCFLTKVLDLVFQDCRNLCCLDTHLSDLFHCILEGRELGADRRVDHLRAHFYDQTADEAFIDGSINSDVFAHAGLERLGEFVRLRFGQRFGGCDICCHFTLVGGNDLAQRLQQLWQHEQATLVGHEGQCVGHQRAHARLFSDGRDGRSLIGAAVHRRIDQCIEVAAFGHCCGQNGNICLKAFDVLALFGKLVHGRRIAGRNTCGNRSWFGHVHPFDVLAPVRE